MWNHSCISAPRTARAPESVKQCPLQEKCQISIKIEENTLRGQRIDKWNCRRIVTRISLEHLPFFAKLCQQAGNSCKEKKTRWGDDWKRTGCSSAKYQLQSFSIAPWERVGFASVQSKVPFLWHFLDNRSLINHWPWIRIFKGTTGEQEDGGACVRAWIVWLRTLNAWAPDRAFQNLINTLVSKEVWDVYTHAGERPTWSHVACLDKDFQVWVIIGGNLNRLECTEA